MSQEAIDLEFDETVGEFYQEQEDNRDPDGEQQNAHQGNDPNITTTDPTTEDLGQDY